MRHCQRPNVGRRVLRPVIDQVWVLPDADLACVIDRLEAADARELDKGLQGIEDGCPYALDTVQTARLQIVGEK